MIDIMDKNGRIIRISARYYSDPMAQSPRSAEEEVVGLLNQLPTGSLLRSPIQRSADDTGGGSKLK